MSILIGGRRSACANPDVTQEMILPGQPIPREPSGQDFRFSCDESTPSPGEAQPFLHPVEAAAEAGPIEPPSCPSWGLIRRCEVNFADTPPSFRPQYTDFAFAKCGATRPAQAAPRSSAACRQTAAGSDVPPRTRASNTARV